MNIQGFKTTAVAVGSTSALALMAATDQATANDLYMGFSIGSVSGDNPSPGDGDAEDYSLTGEAISLFVGAQRELSNGMFTGIELAYTGSFEGDADGSSSYEYAYDVNYNIDAKARIGRRMGGFDVYGFGGLSVGSVSTCCYSADYRYWGVNLGAGAEMNISENMFAGVEYIHRFTEGTEDDADEYSSDHGVLSLRLGYKF